MSKQNYRRELKEADRLPLRIDPKPLRTVLCRRGLFCCRLLFLFLPRHPIRGFHLFEHGFFEVLGAFPSASGTSGTSSFIAFQEYWDLGGCHAKPGSLTKAN